MQVIPVFLVFITLLQSASTLTREMMFELRGENTVYNDHLLYESYALSEMRCAALCSLSKCCVRFTYTRINDILGRCRGHSVQAFQSETGQSVGGTKMYVWTELEDVAGEPSNAALHRPATQSSYMSQASNAVDGVFSTVHVPEDACSHTQLEQGQASWWQVELGDSSVAFYVFSVIITNRDDCCAERLRNFDVHAYADDPSINQSAAGFLCTHYDGPMGAGVTEELVCCNGPIRGRIVRVTNTPDDYLTLCEVQVIAISVV